MPSTVAVRFPTRPPYALSLLLALNVAVFVLWRMAAIVPGLESWAVANLLVSWEAVANGRVWTLLTSAFSQMTLPHLFFNGYALWLFGRDVESIAGHRGLLRLYVMGGLVASMVHLATGWFFGTDVPALGASGSVMALAAAHTLLFPQRRVLLFFLVPMPLWVALLLFVGMDFVGLMSPVSDGIAHGAHLGGALYGLIYYLTTLRRVLAQQLERQLAAARTLRRWW